MPHKGMKVSKIMNASNSLFDVVIVQKSPRRFRVDGRHDSG
jgi:hypothetical protein